MHIQAYLLFLSMTIVKLQDIKSTPRNPLHSYTFLDNSESELQSSGVADKQKEFAGWYS